MATKGRLDNRCILMAIAFFLSCGRTYVSEFESKSPIGATCIRVLRDHPENAADYRIRVEVIKNGRVKVLYRDDRQSSVGLVEANWSSDGRTVGLFMCNLLSGPVLMAYDIEQETSVSGEAIKALLENQIRRRYKVPGGIEVVRWACSTAGTAAYRRVR